MSTDNQLSSPQLVTLGVFLLGGDVHEVDTEDIAMKVNELAPGRYTWRKYPTQINMEVIRAFLSDAKKPKNGGYLSGKGREGWLLTPSGLEFARANVKRLDDVEPTARLTQKEERWRKTERRRIASTVAFQRYRSDAHAELSTRDAERVFRVNDYIRGDARTRKVHKLLNAFARDMDIGKFLLSAARLVLGEGA